MENQDLKIIFLGTPEFAAIILERIWQTQLKPILAVTTADKPAGRKQILTSPAVKVAAEKFNIPVLQPRTIQKAKYEMQKIQPDLIVLAAYGQIIPQEILEIPKFGSLNIHPSLLPKYRGPSPIQNAILNGDEETGITIIKMSERIDEGPIIAAQKIKIDNKKITFSDLMKELADLASDLLLKTIPQWIEGKIEPVVQDESLATYTRIIKKEDGKIDWKQSAQALEKQIRALTPWPGAYSYININNQKRQIKFITADILEQTKNGPFGIPGKTFLAPNDKIAVQTGKDFLVINELQMEGKKQMSSAEFIRGHLKLIGNVLY